MFERPGPKRGEAKYEVWKSVKMWPYWVSNYGRIRKKYRSGAHKILKGKKHPSGWLIDLNHRGKKKFQVKVVHLMRLYFFPDKTGAMYFRDGNKFNIRFDNIAFRVKPLTEIEELAVRLRFEREGLDTWGLSVKLAKEHDVALPLIYQVKQKIRQEQNGNNL